MEETNKNKKYKISVICIFNNTELLNRFLLPSIEKQKYLNYEILLIDSEKLKFTKAADALNYGYSVSLGDILLFVHQDVELLDCQTLSQIADFCSDHEFGIAGVAGIVQNEKKVYSSVIQGDSKQNVGEKASHIIYADSVDECLFFFKRNSFKEFDDLGNTWHLYAVDYSIKCKLKNEDVVIVPIKVYHYSPGLSLDDSYWKAVISLGKLYKNKIHKIPTVFGVFPNNGFLFIYIMLKRRTIDIKKLLERMSLKNE